MDNVIKQLEGRIAKAESIIGSGYPGVVAPLNEDLEFWNSKTEESSDVQERLAQYWGAVGVHSFDPVDDPWSAAWVSYHMPADFPGAASHQQYTTDIIEGKAPNYVAYSLKKNPEIQAEIGDIIVKPRSPTSGLTAADAGWWWSHGDIVHQVDPDVIAVGGNLGDTVRAQSPVGPNNWGPYWIILKRKKKSLLLWPLLLVGGLVGVWWVNK